MVYKWLNPPLTTLCRELVPDTRDPSDTGAPAPSTPYPATLQTESPRRYQRRAVYMNVTGERRSARCCRLLLLRWPLDRCGRHRYGFGRSETDRTARMSPHGREGPPNGN